MKYEAFISYKRSEMNQKLTTSLERSLKSYAKPLLKPPIKIFRDAKELRPGDDLSASLKIALENSKYFLYIASRDAAQSLWVQKELRYWCKNLGRAENLIICHIADNIDVDVNNGTINWEATDALPAFLVQFLKPLPVYIDLTWAPGLKELDLDNIRFREIINALRARFQKKTPSEMNDEHILAHRKNQRLKIVVQALIATLIAVSILFAGYALQKRDEANIQMETATKEKNRAVVNSLVSEARRLISLDNTKALRVAELAYQLSKNNSPEKIPLISRVLIEIENSSRQAPFYSKSFSHNQTSNKVNSVVHSPNGKYLLTASDDETAKLWTHSGKLLNSFKHNDTVDNAVFSPDCEKVLTTCSKKNYSTIWDIKSTGKVVLRHQDWVLSAQFSPHGNRVLTSSRDRTAVLWDLKGTKLWTFEYAKETSTHYSCNFVNSACFSPDGSKILTAADYGPVILWDSGRKKIKKIKSFHYSSMSDKNASFSPNGRFILTHSRFKDPDLWDLEGKHIRTIRHNPRSRINNTTFHPKEDKILTVSDDKTARLWDCTGNELTLFRHNEKVERALFSPSGKKIITFTEGPAVYLWKDDGTFLSHFKQIRKISAASCAPDEATLITASSGGTINLFNLALKTFHEVRYTSNTMPNRGIHFSQDGKKILTMDGSKSVKILDNKWEETAELIHKGEVQLAKLSSDGKKILTIHSEKIGTLWDSKGNEISTHHFHEKVFNAVFSPCGRWLLIVSESDTTRIIDLEWKAKLEIPKTSTQTPAIFSPKGKRVLYVNTDLKKTSNYRVAFLLDIKRLSLVRFMHRNDINSLDFSPDGTKILTSCDDNYAMLWSTEGIPIKSFPSNGRVLHATFSPQGDKILTSSSDHTAKLWTLDGDLLKEFKHDDWVRAGAFSKDGEYIATFSSDNIVQIWGKKYNLCGMFRRDRLIGHIKFSPGSDLILIFSNQLNLGDYRVDRAWYTPQKIIQWLGTANIPQLTIKEKRRLLNGN